MEYNKTEKKSDARPVKVLEPEGKVKAGYVPVGYKDQDEFLKCMRKEYEADVAFDEYNRREALDDKKFTAGEQWDQQVLEQRQGLPTLTINSIPQFTAQLVGDWREERPSIKVLASEDGDTEVAEVRADLIRSIENASRASRVYDAGFESMVQCGDGAWRVAVEFAKDDAFDQDIRIRPIEDALSVVWDRYAIDPTGRDARHVFVDDRLPRDEFKEKWPEHDPSTLGDDTRGNCVEYGWLDDDSVRVTEYWRMIERDRLLCLFEDGSMHFIDEDSPLDELASQHGAVIRSRVAPCLYAQLHFVTGFAILDGPYEYKLNRVPVIRCTGRVVNVGGKRIRYGLVRYMKDPVRLKNFWRSVAAEQLGYAPKAQWWATESAVEGREEDIRNAHLSRDPLLVFNDEAVYNQTFGRLDPPIPQAALLNEAQVNAQDMKDVTGIHDASLGIRSNETSGKAIMSRQKEGDIASLTYYDNGNASVLETGDVINQLIGQIYDSTRIVRIIGEDQAVKFVKLNDPSDPRSPNIAVGKFDVELSSGPSYTTRRAEAAEAMMQAVQVWPEIMQIAGDLVVKAQQWPGSDKLADRLKKAIPPQFLDPEDQATQGQQPQGPGPEQMQMIQEEASKMQEELQKLQLENNNLKQKYDIELRKLEIEEYNAETLRIRALSDHEVDNTKMEQDAIKKILDMSDKERDREHQKEQTSMTANAAKKETT